MYFLNLGDLILSVLCNDHSIKLKENKNVITKIKYIKKIRCAMPLKRLYATIVKT